VEESIIDDIMYIAVLYFPQFIIAIFNTRDQFLSSNFAGITPAIG